MNEGLMHYIGAGSGARKYVGAAATGYDAKREQSPKWHAEQSIIENLIDIFPDGSSVLDVPVGTGRFIAAYERNGHRWLGIDLSQDMLAEANSKVTRPELAKLVSGDVTKLDKFMPPASVDMAIMCRLTRWLTPEQRTQALRQLQTVARHQIVFTARIANHPYAYPMADIKSAILPEWDIAATIDAGEANYRVIVLERSA